MKMKCFLLAILMLVMLCGCSGEAAPAETTAPAAQETVAPTEAAVLNMQELYDAMTGIEGAPEMVALDADMQLNFCGINPADCLQSNVAICGNSLRTDEIWLIEAVDEAALERIRAMAEARLTAKGEESITYSPEQYAIVQDAQIFTQGNYFALIVSPDVDALSEIFCSAAGI